MKHHLSLSRSVLLAGLFLLALSFLPVSPVQAEEIWVEPVPVAKKSLGNWSNTPVKQKKGFVTFKWRVPDDYNGGSDSARIVLVSLKDQEISYIIDTSRVEVEDLLLTEAFNSTTGPTPLTRGMDKELLDEINVPLPPLVAGDYISVKFINKTKKSKLIVLGLRYTYPGDWNKSGSNLWTSGNIGVNTSSPSSDLHILNGGNVALSTVNNGSLLLGSPNGTNIAMDPNDIQARVNGAAAIMHLNKFGGDISLGNGTSTSRVGIGTTNPLQPLHVIGNGYFTTSLGIRTSSPVTGLHVASGSGTSLINPGYVVLGSTGGINLSMDNQMIQARDNAAGATLWLNFFGGDLALGSGSASGNTFIATGSTTSDVLMTSNNAGSRVGIGTVDPSQKLHVVGDALVSGTITAAAFVQVSDQRRKKNIEALDTTLDKVMDLKPARYHFKTEDDSGSKHFGFIAQELKRVFPEVVSVDPDSGEFGPGEEGLHTVSYSELIPVLIKGMQEQQTIIQEEQAANDKQQALIHDVQAQLEVHKKQQAAYQELEGMVQKMKMKLDRLEQAGWTLAGNK